MRNSCEQRKCIYWDGTKCIDQEEYIKLAREQQQYQKLLRDPAQVAYIKKIDPLGYFTLQKLKELTTKEILLLQPYVEIVDENETSKWITIRKAISSFEQHKADRIIAEVNNGGDLVLHLLQQVNPNVPVKKVTASRGKQVRAEPIAALFEQGRAHLVGYFTELEDELCEWEPGTNMKSPDRMDAMVWALTELSEGSNTINFLAGMANFCPNCKMPVSRSLSVCPACNTSMGA